jgi:hypothetical protein
VLKIKKNKIDFDDLLFILKRKSRATK